nr:MAG TPA: hypothetical protein [Caudoviricetes sp.]
MTNFSVKKDKLYVQGANIGYRKFTGEPERFNQYGEKSFVIFLDNPEDVDLLLDLGLNVKVPVPDETKDPELDRRKPFVKVKLGKYPQVIQVIETDEGLIQNELEDNEVSLLQRADLKTVDLIINLRPYTNELTKESGVSAYLNKGYFVLDADPFYEKYGARG